MNYYGIINAETLREVSDRVYTQMFKEQLAEIDEALKCIVADDPTITEAEFELDEIYDETIAGLKSAGYNVNVYSSDDDDGTIILSVSWMEEDNDDCCCKCDCCQEIKWKRSFKLLSLLI